MALYLKKWMLSTIMLLSRWCNDAFLFYVSHQVQEFSPGVIADMVSQAHFFTIPDVDEHDNLDPRTRNPQSFAKTISLNGSNTATAHVQRPAMRIWH